MSICVQADILVKDFSGLVHDVVEEKFFSIERLLYVSHVKTINDYFYETPIQKVDWLSYEFYNVRVPFDEQVCWY